jgi:hypothetical protein
MSTFAVLTTLSLFSGHVLAQVYWASCTVPSFGWVPLNHFFPLSFTDHLSKTYNSIEQNPCTVAAFLLSTCNGGSQSSFSCTTSQPYLRTGYNIQPLPQGYSYTGPTAGTSNTCKCSTVAYSLLSACDACQGSTWFKYVPNPPFAFWAYLFLVGMIIRPTARQIILPHRESLR